MGSLQFPPEAWQRVLWAWQGWLSRHEGLARGLFRLSRISQRITIVLLVVAVLVVPQLAAAMVPTLWMLACLGVMVLLSRTRTVSWRAVSVMFSVSVPWALVVAKATELVAASGGMSTSDDGTSIALAAFVEEPGKLVPLVVVALVAPGRARRLAAVDWALLGYAAGAGFTAAEDGARRLAPQEMLASLLGGDKGLDYSLNAWTAGSFRLWNSDGLLGRFMASSGPSPLAVGHHVSTMTVAMAVGLGIVLWRTGRPLGRVVAWVLPAVALMQVVVDHAAYNASVASLTSVSWLDSDDPLVYWLGAVWQVSGRGNNAIAYSVVLFGLCLLADARRRLRTGALGVTAGEAPRVPSVTAIGGPAFVRAPIEAVVALVVLSYSDLVVIARGYADRRMTRSQRMIEGRLTAAQVMETRRDAMAATTPGVEPAARRVFALITLVVWALIGLVCLWCGVVVAQAIGSSLLFGDSDAGFFAGLLDELATWWESLGPTGQLLVTALGVMLLMSAGSTFALAMGAVGVLTWAAAHGHGLASFIRDPAAATSSYLSNVTPGQLAWDLLDFALTFIPGSVFGAGAHTIARTTARDMAATRTALRQGGKKAAQATEQAAARTEAQRVAESQAAHEKSVNAANEVHKQRRYRTKTVSSEHPAESDHALSGWSEERRPTGFQRPNVDEVLRVTDEMGYPRTAHPYDQGTPGLYHASHAERQKALTAEWPHLGVSKPMCEDCNGWFRKFAQYQGRDWYVTDPNGVWIFRKDGIVNAPDGRIFNPNEIVPPTYF